jgi:uncharacterized radical SAM superfamily Fe-S cluster-containing enzyme
MTGVRNYQYYDFTVSLCTQCQRRVDAKILFKDGNVYMDKRCPEHGSERVLIADDVEYYKRAREQFVKPSEMPNRFQTEIKHGCPFDCGLCPDHEQHSCVTLIEVGERCDLSCPLCYANSGPKVGGFHSMETIERMLDAAVASEGEPDIVQISGGEPTIHPQFFEILDAARARPIRHLMVNTNGVRIARDADFAARLADYMPGFEIYLQFDSFEQNTLQQMRGADLRSTRVQALERLNDLGISTTLVVTLVKGLNDHEVGKILDYALQQPAVRGVTFQPMQDAGRVDDVKKVAGAGCAEEAKLLGESNSDESRLTLTGVRRRILEQSDLFAPADILPVPCHPDCIAMAYALKTDGKAIPLTGMIDPQVFLEGGNTISFERDPELKEKLFAALSTAHSPVSGAASLADLLCCLPKVELPEQVGYENLFRVIIMRFQDAQDFDVRSIKKSCVHVVHPQDMRIIPLETYNLFYRNTLESPLSV